MSEKFKVWPELFCDKCKEERNFLKFEIPEDEKAKYWTEIYECPTCGSKSELQAEVTTT